MKLRWLSVMVLAVVLLCVVCLSVPAEAVVDLDTVNASIDFAASTTQVCPVCGGDAVEWQPLPQVTSSSGLTLTSGHYYVPDGGLENAGAYRLTEEKRIADVCIHLNGQTITSAARFYNANYQLTLNIFGEGTVTSTGLPVEIPNDLHPYEPGGSVFMLETADVTLYGGTYSCTTGVPVFLKQVSTANYPKMTIYPAVSIAGPDLTAMDESYPYKDGGVIYMQDGTLKLNGCTLTPNNAVNGGVIRMIDGKLDIDDCTFANVAVSGNGGVLAMDGGAVNITNCTFTDCTAGGYGGALAIGNNIDNNCHVNITDSTISGGSAISGGNVYVQGTAEVALTIENSPISGGTATGTVFDTETNTVEGGGNIYLDAPMTCTINATEITNGTATNGGNILVHRGTLNLYGVSVYGGGAPSGSTGTTRGGNILAYSTVTSQRLAINLCNDATYGDNSITGGTATYGGNIYSGGTLTLDNGTISDGTATKQGGNIYSSGAITINNGTISGGKATNNGGNIYSTGRLTINDGTITKGTCTDNSGGNIYVDDTLTINGGTISDGTAPGGGGNIYARASVNLSGGTISGGYSKLKYGGNIRVAANTMHTVTIKNDVLITGGEAVWGGNIAIQSAAVVMTGGTISDGEATGEGTSYGGGNVYLEGGSFVMNSGTISGGSALGGHGGNIYSNACDVTIADDPATDAPKPVVTNGESKYTGGNVIAKYADSSLTIGSCEISLGNSVEYDYGDDISIPATGFLTVQTDYDAEADIYFPEESLPTKIPGGMIVSTAGQADGPFNGILRLDMFPEQYILSGKLNDPNRGLYICDTGILTKDGQFIYINNNADIVEEAKNYSDCVLRVTSGELDLSELNTEDFIVDLYGNTVEITGSNGQVSIIDTTNDTFETFGTTTVENGAEVKLGATTFGDKVYYTINENGTYSTHRIINKLYMVSLRPSCGGIYFTGHWECDAKLQEKIDGFGVAVSLVDMPGADFDEESHNLWTSFSTSEFESGVKKTGVIIKNILKEDSPDENAARAIKPIHATAYVIIDGENYVENGQSFSLLDVLNILNDNIASYAQHQTVLKNFMAKWSQYGLTGEPWDALTFEIPQS